MYGQNTLNINNAGSANLQNEPVVTFSVAVKPETANIAVVNGPADPQASATETIDSVHLSQKEAASAESRQSVLPSPKTESAISSSKDTSGNQKKPSKFALKKVLIAGLAIGLFGFASVSGYHAYNHFTSHQETEDAYTTGHQHQISTRVNGTVEKVLVDDNEHVKKGQVLAILDPRDYEVRVSQARASLELAINQAEAAKKSIVLSSSTATGKSTEAEAGLVDAEAAVSRAEAALLEAQAAVPKAEADLRAKEAEETRAKADGRRFVRLANEGAVSYQDRDGAVRDYEVAKSSREAAGELLKQSRFKLVQATHAVNMAKAQVNQSRGLVQQADATHVQTQVNEKQFDVAKSSIHQAEVQLHDAELQLSYTKIIAPVDGRVGKKTVEPGQRIQPGQQLMTIVADDIWVVANFKETQLERLRPHQAVEIKIDSFPNQKFIGTVDSVSPGSGASFALLPPDNATGNFTKIVQRVPVKIRFDRASTKGFENLLVPGMSAIVSVDVQNRNELESSSALANSKSHNSLFAKTLGNG